MKKITKVLALTTCLAGGVVFADNNLGVVDMQQIFKTSPQVQKINADLQTQFSSRKTTILGLNGTLEKDVQNLNKNKAVLSSKQTSTLKAKIAKEETDLRNQQQQFQQDLYAAQNKAMASFMTTVQAAVKTIATSKSIALVVPKNAALYYAPSLDLTSAVMKKLG